MTKEIEVRKGYKKTKVGVIPEEWEVERLSSIFSHFKSGLGITSNNISNMGEFPVFGGNGLRGFTNSYTHNGSYILIGRQGALCGNIRFASGQIYISEHAIAAQTNDLNDLQYFKYKLEYKKLNRLSESSAQPGLSVIKLLRVKLDVPPLAEQQKIATILTTWDKAIENVQLVIDNLKVRNKGLAQQLLTGKKRLKGFEGEWRKEKLGKLLKEVKSKPVKCPEQYELISIKLYGKGIISTGKFPKNTKRGRSYHFRNEGEIIIGRQNFHNGSIAFMPKFKNKMIASNAISSFSSVNGIDDCWIINYLLRPSFYLWVENLIGGTGQKEINRKDFNNIPIVVPPFKEQQAIAKVLTNADQELKLYEKKLVALQEQKKGLMQKLLTGQIRVNTKEKS